MRGFAVTIIIEDCYKHTRRAISTLERYFEALSDLSTNLVYYALSGAHSQFKMQKGCLAHE